MTNRPRKLLSELFREVRLTGGSYVIVEGRSDVTFFQVWARKLHFNPAPIFLEVDRLEVGPDILMSYNFNDSQRSRVVVVAREAFEREVSLRCVADRDTGCNVDNNNFETLLWTDYPAIESYAMTRSVLDLMNISIFRNRYNADDLFNDLSRILSLIYSLRLKVSNLPALNYDKSFPQRGVLEKFTLERAVSDQHKELAKTCAPSKATDPRKVSYGHDIASLLFFHDKQFFKGTLHITDVAQLEDQMLKVVEMDGNYRTEPLFQQLEHWLNA